VWSSFSCNSISPTRWRVIRYEIADRFIVIDRGEIVSSIEKAKISLKELDEFLLEYSHGLKDKVEP
jgi:ABC-type Na+ transport system ATPase subunit NatA